MVQNKLSTGIIWVAELKQAITTVLPNVLNWFQDIKTISCENIELCK